MFTNNIVDLPPEFLNYFSDERYAVTFDDLLAPFDEDVRGPDMDWSPVICDKPAQVFVGWENVPKGFATWDSWSWRYTRKVRTDETPTAVVRWTETRKRISECDEPDGTVMRTEWGEYTKEFEANLYSFDQTREYNPRPRWLAVRQYWETFVKFSNRDHHIWITDEGWKSCRGKLRREEMLAHLNQEAVYGVRGQEKITRWGGIDHDLHAGDLGIYLEQMKILLETFCGRDGWHQIVSEKDAGGVHYVQVLPKTVHLDKYRKWLRRELEKLDLRFPELAQRAVQAGMRSFSTMEIYPDTQQGFRLPLAKGRTVLLDKPLQLIERRKKMVIDIEGYMAWVTNPTIYMSKAEVMEYIQSRLRARTKEIRVDSETTATEILNNSVEGAKAAGKTSGNGADIGKMRGRYAAFLKSFWGGENTPPDSLDKAIRLLALMTPYYFANQDEAILVIEKFVDALPDVSFSDRLAAGDREKVSRKIRSGVAKAFDNFAGQPDPDASRVKLAKTYQAWSARGFNPFDKATWTNLGTELGDDFSWTEQEKVVLDRLQKVLKTNFATTERVIKHLIRIIAKHPGELSITFVERILGDFGIRRGSNRDRKANKVLELLRKVGWIYMRVAEKWFPRRKNGKSVRGRGRAYGIGEALRYKFGMVSTDNDKEEKREDRLLLQHHPFSNWEPLGISDFLEYEKELQRLTSKKTNTIFLRKVQFQPQ